MRIVQLAVTRSTWPIAGGIALIAMVLTRPQPGPELLPPPPIDVPSVEVPVQTEWFQLTARDPAPPPPSHCVLAGRPGSAARERAAIAWLHDLSKRDREITEGICADEMNEPCLGFVHMKGESARDGLVQDSATHSRMTRMAGRVSEPERGCVADYCTAIRPKYCDTPLVLAFASQPIEFLPANASFAFSPGTPVATDWPTATTPWIAIDLDHDGAITSGAELFGDATRLPDGSTAGNGFAALAALDANHDGVIDAADPAFSSLLLWADRNADRASSPDELRPLAGVVTAIPLANHVEPRCVHGNCEGERGTFRWNDGGTERTGAVVDVYLLRR